MKANNKGFSVLQNDFCSEDKKSKADENELKEAKFSVSIPNEKDEKDNVIIGTYEEAPDYLQDNEFIKKGYRINCNNTIKVLKSLFVLHNETINIWSHLLGCIMSIIFMIYTGTVVIHAQDSKEIMPYSQLISDFKDTTAPWIDSFNKIEEEYQSEEIKKILNNIKTSTSEFLKDISEKVGLNEKFNQYNKKIKELLNEAKSKFDEVKKSEVFVKINTTWNRVQKKLINIMDVYGMSIESSQKKAKLTNNENRLVVWPLFIMLISSIICLGCSATYHWFMPLSKSVNTILSRLDYAGITLLVAGSCYPPYYYYYYCTKCKYFLI